MNVIEGYAKGLFEIANAEGTLDEVEDELFRFARSYESSEDLSARPTDPQDVSREPTSTTDAARRSFPGLINCHAHMARCSQRGFNEDSDSPIPRRSHPALQPPSGEEATLMSRVAALEASGPGRPPSWRTPGTSPLRRRIGRNGFALRVRRVHSRSRESCRPMSPEGFAKSEAPRFSPKLRDEGMQRIKDLFTAWHGQETGTHQRLPGRGARRDASPELLQAVRAFAEKHDLGYTIHLNQSGPKSSSW